jgi:hypothetical protein
MRIMSWSYPKLSPADKVWVYFGLVGWVFSYIKYGGMAGGSEV